MYIDDTIAAIATAYGEGGIGIIRISGENALDILNTVFVPKNKSKIKSRRMTYGTIVKDGHVIDEVLAVYMKAPYTYTAEDVVEINCHGSVVSLKNTLAYILENGARLAEPGEFTKRAFLNGRLDLSQAEAVIDVVKAKTDKSFDVAMSQLEGALSDTISEIRKKLLDVLVDFTVNIDYPDEDIEELTYDKLYQDISLIGEMIEKLMDSAATGRMVREGIKVAIVGKPNVGKSSLMNRLLKENRAIVTEIPGTTRDTIEESVNIRGIPVYLIDTAGIRQTDDTVEQLGIERSKQAFNNADLIVFIIDGSKELSDEDREIIEYLKDKKSLVLLNKRDVGIVQIPTDIKDILPNSDIIETSLINGEGVSEIEDAIEALVYDGKVSQNDSIMISNVRHLDLIKKSFDSINSAKDMIKRNEALDFAEMDIKQAYSDLGEITGDSVNDDIINEVFSRFCLGK